jgi:hypothetical protein
MPTKIVKYQCDICDEIFDLKAAAMACEAQGLFDGSSYPAGLMWEYYHSGYIGIFALPEQVVMCTSGWNKGHLGTSANGIWACRATTAGDTIGDERCGGNDYYRSDPFSVARFKESHIIDKHLNSPEFNRMVGYLKSHGITPSYYTKTGELVIIKN